MNNGWIKLWRKSIDSGLIKNHNVWIFWTYCLLKANHEKDFKCVVGYQEIVLRPGQFIFGFLKASEETGLTIQNIRTCIAFLKKCQNLTIKTTNKYSVISIINWNRYQQKENRNNMQTNTRVTSSQQASNKQTNNIQEGIQEQKNIYTPNFLKFWKSYPKKTGKGAAYKSYKNITEPKPTLSVILNAVKEQSFSEQWQDKRYIPNPATWINQRRWEDEINNTLTKKEILQQHGF